jgi:hypothetical protein
MVSSGVSDVFGAQALGQPSHVFFQGVWPPDSAQEFPDAAAGIVGEPEFVGDGDDAVGICGESGVAARLEADVARVGIDQAGLVEAVAAHHAADGVGDQALAVFFAVGAGQGDLGFGNFGGEFVLESMN